MKKKVSVSFILLATFTTLCQAMDNRVTQDQYKSTLEHMLGQKKTQNMLNTLNIYEQNTPELEQGNNLFFIIDGAFGSEKFGFGDKIFKKINSSAKNNNCMLYSVIRNDLTLLTQIMGDEHSAKNILSQPECANVPEEDANNVGIIRRPFQSVRKKIFDEIKIRMNDTFFGSDMDTTSPRIILEEILNDKDENVEYIEDNKKYKGYLNFPGIQSVPQNEKPGALLDFLYKHDYPLDTGFASIISLLYRKPIIICNPAFKIHKKDEIYENSSYMSILSSPNFLPADDPIFIYINGGHYEKLTENILEDASIYLDLPKIRCGVNPLIPAGFFLTDGNWVNGIARNGAAFFVPNTPPFTANYKIGNSVKFMDNQNRIITNILPNGNYLNVHVEGEALNPNKVGLPSQFIATDTVYDSFFLTDANWEKGIAKHWAGFFVPNTPTFSNKYKVSKYVYFGDGSCRKITGIKENGGYLNINVDGNTLNARAIGLPSHFTLV